jgi:hypothetical protein
LRYACAYPDPVASLCVNRLAAFGPIGGVADAVMLVHPVVHETVKFGEAHEWVAGGLLFQRRRGLGGVVMARVDGGRGG